MIIIGPKKGADVWLQSIMTKSSICLQLAIILLFPTCCSAYFFLPYLSDLVAIPQVTVNSDGSADLFCSYNYAKCNEYNEYYSECYGMTFVNTDGEEILDPKKDSDKYSEEIIEAGLVPYPGMSESDILSVLKLTSDKKENTRINMHVHKLTIKNATPGKYTCTMRRKYYPSIVGTITVFPKDHLLQPSILQFVQMSHDVYQRDGIYLCVVWGGEAEWKWKHVNEWADISMYRNTSATYGQIGYSILSTHDLRNSELRNEVISYIQCGLKGSQVESNIYTLEGLRHGDSALSGYGFFYWFMPLIIIVPFFILVIFGVGICACVRGNACRCCTSCCPQSCCKSSESKFIVVQQP